MSEREPEHPSDDLPISFEEFVAKRGGEATPTLLADWMSYCDRVWQAVQQSRGIEFAAGLDFAEGSPLEDESPPLEETSRGNVNEESVSSRESFPLGVSASSGSTPRTTKASRDPLPAALTGEQLRLLDSDARMVEVALGRGVVEGERVPCFLPGHEREAWIARRQDGRFVHICDCDRIERSLTEVYIARGTGVLRKRSVQEFLLWRLRQAAVARIVSLPPLDLPACPDGTSETTVTVYNGLRLLLRVRQLTEQRNEATFTFTYGFAAGWCRVSQEEAKAALAALVSAGVLVRGDRVPVSGGLAHTYRLGGRA